MPNRKHRIVTALKALTICTHERTIYIHAIYWIVDMKVLVIHLSDLHLEESNNELPKRKEALCRAMQNSALEADTVFIVITGDITSKGKETEFTKAKELLSCIKDEIEKYSRKRTRLLMVPGNHDCCFEIEEKKIRKNLIEVVKEKGAEAIDNETIEKCCEVQGNFEEFIEYYGDDRNVIYSDKLVKIVQFNIDGYSIVFYCYNTSWMSEQKEQRGTIRFPTQMFPGDYLEIRSDLSVSILHHPFYWHNPDDVKNMSDHLERTSDIVLTGHSHVSSKSIKDDMEGNYTEYIEGKELQSEKVHENTGFATVFVELDDETHKISTYEWNGRLYDIVAETDWLPLKRYKSLGKQVHKVNKTFEKDLEYAGGPYTHPNKTNITLSDIFIYPRIRELTLEEREKGADVLIKPIDSKTLCELDESGNKIILIGGDKCGKTSLCYTLFKNYHKKGFVPIYIKGAKIKYTDIKRINSLLKRYYTEEYYQDNLSEFVQLENHKKVLIIDDINTSKLNAKYLRILLTNIGKYYPNIIVVGDYLLQAEDILSERDQEYKEMADYKQYEIMEFGHVLRSELINKWNSLGVEEFIAGGELIHKNDEARGIVDTIIGKNLVPAYPIFILTILQSIEMRESNNLAESTYGHYYNFLIIKAIGKTVQTNDKIEGYFNFLTELANYIFEQKVAGGIKDEKMIKFHEWYCKEYKISPRFVELYDFNRLIRNLQTSRLIEKKWDAYRFIPRYVYYFFMARYLAVNIASREVKQIIAEMCKRLYRTEFANIILFLTHHSKDRSIIQGIIRNSKKIFKEFTPVEFGTDVHFINGLMDEIPNLVLEERSVKEHRAKKDEIKDEKELAEKREEKDEEVPDLKERIIRLDFASKLNLSFKHIDILGLTLKNYHSSLKGPIKYELAEEAYNLGLRSIHPFFGIFEEHTDYVVRVIRAFVEERGIVGREKIENISRRFLFFLAKKLSYDFIKRISGSLGSENLSETFREIKDKNKTIAIDLVDMSIKLDYYQEFPFADIIELKKKLTRPIAKYKKTMIARPKEHVTNPLALTLLGEMVVNYLYMFPTDVKDKQRICNILEIPMAAQRAIDLGSSQKKRK